MFGECGLLGSARTISHLCNYWQDSGHFGGHDRLLLSLTTIGCMSLLGNLALKLHMKTAQISLCKMEACEQNVPASLQSSVGTLMEASANDELNGGGETPFHQLIQGEAEDHD